MEPSSRSVRLGRWLFRWRGLTPVPVVAALLALEAFEVRCGEPAWWDGVRWAIGLSLCLTGQGLRAWIRGVVPEGTSSATRSLSAASLNTEGAYRHTRNPLYLGNFLLCAGLLLQLRSPAAWLLGMGFFFGEYHFIIRSEEDFLLGRFGDRYRQFLNEVPRFWPRLRPAPSRAVPTRFDAGRALRSEHNVAAAWLSALLAVSALRSLARAHALAAILPQLGASIALSAAYLVIKGWKRGWWLSSRNGTLGA